MLNLTWIAGTIIEKLIYMALIIIGAIIIFIILKKITKHYWKKYKIDQTGYHLFLDIIKYCICLVALTWILNEIGIDLRGIFLSVGIMGIIIGLAAKDIFSNFMSGALLIHDKTIKKDEVIQLKKVKGRVEKITFRTTKIKTEEDFTVIIPNNVLNNTEFTIYKELELHKIKLNMNIPYNINIKEFEEKLKEKVYTHEWVNKNKNPHIENIELTEYGYKILFFVWIDEYQKKSEYKVIIAQDAEEIIKTLGKHLKISS